MRDFFPACVGSMDGIHFRWDGFPAGLQNECTGRSKKPTLAFQIMLMHRRQFLGVSKGKKLVCVFCFSVFVANSLLIVLEVFVGTRNDSMIAELYPAVLALSEHPYAQLTWTTSDGVEHHVLYFIVDGRYSGWSTLIAPFEEGARDLLTDSWSEHLESV